MTALAPIELHEVNNLHMSPHLKHLLEQRVKLDLDHLPTELLVNIFTFACYDSHIIPVLLSHVSARWREIALNTSILWTKIVIIGGDKAVFTLMRTGPYCAPRNQWINPSEPALEIQHAHRIVTERASTFLDRSRTTLVDFVFDLGMRGSIKGSSVNTTVGLEALLMDNLHRARSLDVSFIGNLDWSWIFSRGSDDYFNVPWMPLHNMAELKLIHAGHSYAYISHLTLRPTLFPNLHSLTIDNFGLPSNSIIALKPVQNFTWTVHSLLFSDVIKHLENASSLREFTFTNPDLILSTLTTSQPLPLANLESLTKFDWSFPLPHHVALFFLSVSTSNLVDLTIRLRSYSGNRPSEVPNHPLITLSCLQSLRLDLVQFDQTAISCIRDFSFPSLIAFHLSCRLKTNLVHDRPFIPAFESVFRDPSLLAAPGAGLRTLSLSGFIIGALAGRAASVLQHLTRLRTLIVEFCTGVDDVLWRIATERWTCPDLMEVHLRNVTIEERTLIRLVESRTKPHSQIMAPAPPKTAQHLRKAGVLVGEEKQLKGDIETQRICTLRLVKCEGVGELARKRLRAVVDDFDYI